MNRIIDLHSHSHFSLDGELTPQQLVDKAIEEGVKYYAVSDHDDVRAVGPALQYAEGKDITIIPAAEISAIIDDCPLHILGYNIDYNNPLFTERKNQINETVVEFDRKAIIKAREFGFIFDEEKLHQFREDGLFCEEHIGEVVLADQRNDDNPILKQFREGGRLSDNPPFNFYREFFSTGKPLNIPYDFNMDIKDASRLIHEGGGKMFLAHPGHNIKRNEQLLEKIISFGLDGIESFSSYHDRETNEFYYEMAKKYNLYMSVGSDFHGRSKPSIRMGSIDYDEDELNRTLKYLEVL